jgi:DNA-binding transcriptional MerR regulator/effector-binding domain-containing protein
MLNIGEFARLGQVSPRMLRHYDETGLLKPSRVDPQTGYRSYEVAQLGRLHRLLALRDLGFTLEQIRPMLDDDTSVDQLRGMLRLRQAQIEQDVADEQGRLRRVEAHLRALEGSASMPANDVVVRQTRPLRMAEAVATAAGFGPLLGDVLARLYPTVIAHLTQAGARPGLCVAWYEEPSDDGSVVVHAGFDIGTQTVPESSEVRVVELPVIEVASLVHRGPMDEVEPVYEGLVRWVEDSGYRLAGRSRELYHEWHDDDPSRNVTELQMPITSQELVEGSPG